MKKRILEVNELHTSFKTSKGLVGAIRGIDLHVNEGEILGIVGESGSGKKCYYEKCHGTSPIICEN